MNVSRNMRSKLRGHIDAMRTAIPLVFSRRSYLGLATSTFLVLSVFYMFTLPATYTGGRVGIASLRYLTPLLTGFAVVLAGLMSVIIGLTAYNLRIGGSTETTTTATGIAGSVLPPILCCSPLLPTLAAAVVGIFPAAFGVSGWIQGVIATYEIEILTGATLLLVYAVVQNAKGVMQCAT
jgi:hypothetical protein